MHLRTVNHQIWFMHSLVLSISLSLIDSFTSTSLAPALMHTAQRARLALSHSMADYGAQKYPMNAVATQEKLYAYMFYSN